MLNQPRATHQTRMPHHWGSQCDTTKNANRCHVTSLPITKHPQMTHMACPLWMDDGHACLAFTSTDSRTCINLRTHASATKQHAKATFGRLPNDTNNYAVLHVHSKPITKHPRNGARDLLPNGWVSGTHTSSRHPWIHAHAFIWEHVPAQPSNMPKPRPSVFPTRHKTHTHTHTHTRTRQNPSRHNYTSHYIRKAAPTPQPQSLNTL